MSASVAAAMVGEMRRVDNENLVFPPTYRVALMRDRSTIVRCKVHMNHSLYGIVFSADRSQAVANLDLVHARKYHEPGCRAGRALDLWIHGPVIIGLGDFGTDGRQRPGRWNAEMCNEPVTRNFPSPG